MVNNFMCENCDKAAVCKIINILEKFSDDAKSPLGVDITIESCENYNPDNEETV